MAMSSTIHTLKKQLDSSIMAIGYGMRIVDQLKSNFAVGSIYSRNFISWQYGSYPFIILIIS